MTCIRCGNPDAIEGDGPPRCRACVLSWGALAAEPNRHGEELRTWLVHRHAEVLWLDLFGGRDHADVWRWHEGWPDAGDMRLAGSGASWDGKLR